MLKENLTIMVIGDICLDKYAIGDVTRISPEAPIPIVSIKETELRAGMAGNVCRNLASLKQKVHLISMTGGLSAICSKLVGVNTFGVIRTTSRSEIIKTRVIGNNQQIVRIDEFDNQGYLQVWQEDLLLQNFYNQVKGTDAIIISDYCKGICTNRIIKNVRDYCNRHNIPLIVDTKRNDFIDGYVGVTVMTPNEKEASQMTSLPIKNQDNVFQVGQILLDWYELDACLITQGEKGMSLITDEYKFQIPAHQKINIADVSGAGDTVIAVFTTAIASGLGFKKATRLANKAGGIVASKKGTAIITRQELLT